MACSRWWQQHSRKHGRFIVLLDVMPFWWGTYCVKLIQYILVLLFFAGTEIPILWYCAPTRLTWFTRGRCPRSRFGSWPLDSGYGIIYYYVSVTLPPSSARTGSQRGTTYLHKCVHQKTLVWHGTLHKICEIWVLELWNEHVKACTLSLTLGASGLGNKLVLSLPDFINPCRTCGSCCMGKAAAARAVLPSPAVVLLLVCAVSWV